MQPFCFVCGYALVGLQRPICPECGTDFQSDARCRAGFAQAIDAANLLLFRAPLLVAIPALLMGIWYERLGEFLGLILTGLLLLGLSDAKRAAEAEYRLNSYEKRKQINGWKRYPFVLLLMSFLVTLQLFTAGAIGIVMSGLGFFLRTLMLGGEP